MHVFKEEKNNMEKKEVKCIFRYKDGMKEYKLWYHTLRKQMYSKYVVFKEVSGNFNSEYIQTEKEPEKLVFELRKKKADSYESTKSDEEVEQSTLVVRRCKKVRKLAESYSLPIFCYVFVLFATDKEPKSVREAVDSRKAKLWKETMVEEMESFYKNETWDLVELPNGSKSIGSEWVFNKNMNAIGQVEKMRARLVAKEYSQVEAW
jgi:hypothetical protein